MESTLSFRRDGVILVCLHLFGLSYFALFLISFLFFRFPAHADAIGGTQGVIFYCGGAILWFICSLVYRLIWIIHGNDARSRQKLEFVGTLLLIYTSALPVVVHTANRLRYLFPLGMPTVPGHCDGLGGGRGHQHGWPR